MAELPEDVEEALRTIEEFKATAAPEEQVELERTRAVITNKVQGTAQERQRARLADRIDDKYGALADALRGNRAMSGDFPAVESALRNIDELENLERQKNDIEARIAQLEAESEAAFAGANAVLEVRARQSAEARRTAGGNKTRDIPEAERPRDEAPERAQ